MTTHCSLLTTRCSLLTTGLATFLATVDDWRLGVSLGVAIAIHNIPEVLTTYLLPISYLPPTYLPTHPQHSQGAYYLLPTSYHLPLATCFTLHTVHCTLLTASYVILARHALYFMRTYSETPYCHLHPPLNPLHASFILPYPFQFQRPLAQRDRPSALSMLIYFILCTTHSLLLLTICITGHLRGHADLLFDWQ